MADDRTSRYQRKPNRPFDSQLKSPMAVHLCAQLAYLGPTITWKGVIPKGLVWPLDWNLVLMVTMCKCTGCQDGDGEDVSEHDCGRAIERMKKRENAAIEGLEFLRSAALAMLQCVSPYWRHVDCTILQAESWASDG